MLKEKLAELLKVKQPRYITAQFLKSAQEDVYGMIMEATSSLDEATTLSERIWCVVNDMTTAHTCPNCKQVSRPFFKSFDDASVDKRIFSCCSTKCSREFELNIFKEPVDTRATIISLGQLVELLESCKPKFTGITSLHLNSVKHHLAGMGVDYSSMNKSEACFFLLNGLAARPRCYCGEFLNYKKDGEYHAYCSPECNLKSEATKTKRMATCVDKYGVDNVRKASHVKDALRILRRNTQDEVNAKVATARWRNTYSGLGRFKHIVTPCFSMEEFKGCSYETYYDWSCSKCGGKFQDNYINGMIPRCPVCNPKNYNKSQTDLLEFIKSLGLDAVSNTRMVIKPYELDIYVPGKNIAVEFDGLYWHSELVMEKRVDTDARSAHLKKTEACQAKGIRLVHVFEDEWDNKRAIVKSRLRRILGKVEKRIYARRCEVRELDVATKDKFLAKYHLQGTDKSSVRLGLFHKGRLVAVMTFGEMRPALGNKSLAGHYELIRFATIGSFNITGGAGKLLAHFKRLCSPRKIISYADRRWSDGGLYTALGFKLDHTSPPNYWYTRKHLVREHRFKYRKSVLVGQGHDPAMSEWEIMRSLGFDRIWDCGNLVFKMTC